MADDPIGTADARNHSLNGLCEGAPPCKAGIRGTHKIVSVRGFIFTTAGKLRQREIGNATETAVRRGQPT